MISVVMWLIKLIVRGNSQLFAPGFYGKSVNMDQIKSPGKLQR